MALRAGAISRRASGRLTSLLALFDHLFGEPEQRQWNIESERLGSLQIYDERVLVSALDGQIARFTALEDAIGVACSLLEDIQQAGGRPVIHQAALVGKIGGCRNRRQPM